MQGRRLLGQAVLERGVEVVRRVLGQERQGAEISRPGGWDADVDGGDASDHAAFAGEAAESWPAEDLDDPYGDDDAWWERA